MTVPNLKQFRVEPARDGLIHLVFDMPGRTMNVFSNDAIRELETFGAFLKTSDVRGVVIRSGKASGFCAGADLGELGIAYDMIMQAPPAERSRLAFNHFFPLSLAIRSVETSGKPVAVAIAGVALGGGCELALGGHYRVLADSPKAALGLPESLVGLLPGAGGTQRLPRLIGVEAALPILLRGARLAGYAAQRAGLVDLVVPMGEEVAAAEEWALSVSPEEAKARWDRADWSPADLAVMSAVIAQERSQVLAETLGHQPAPLAILDCVEQGFPLAFDEAIRREMEIFSGLIQRVEARNMIQSLFNGRIEYERRQKSGGLGGRVAQCVEALAGACESAWAEAPDALAAAGTRTGIPVRDPVRRTAGAGLWLDESGNDPRREVARGLLGRVARVTVEFLDLDEGERRCVDFATVTGSGFPAHLGGPFLYAALIE